MDRALRYCGVMVCYGQELEICFDHQSIGIHYLPAINIRVMPR